MFTRIVPQDIPEREQVGIEHTLCPPHDFDFGWATKADAQPGDDTVPAIYCKSCGDIRAFRLPADAG